MMEDFYDKNSECHCDAQQTATSSEDPPMNTIEIAENKWDQFFRKVDAVCHGASITVESDGAGVSRKALIEDLPLQSISLDNKTDPCNTNVVIEAGSPNEKPVTQIIVEPIHLRLKNDRDERRYNRLQIIAENGTTSIDLHPGLSGKELKAFELQLPARRTKKARS
jgi:hypothetical protein